MDAASLFSSWPGTRRGLAGLDLSGSEPRIFVEFGDLSGEFELASITKLVTALTTLSCIEGGYLDLDDELDDRGATIRMALSHAAGYSPDSEEVLAAPATRRIYSNYGYLAVARQVEARVRMPFSEAVRDFVAQPLGIASTMSEGHPGFGAKGSIHDVVRLVHGLTSDAVVGDAMRQHLNSVQFDSLVGVLPGFGRMDPCPWGAGAEIKGQKQPHWSGESFGPSSFGHFGRAGGFVLVDPDRQLGIVALGEVDFGAWAAALWPLLTDEVARLV
jgi:CubicO group peptidase (beta-lactamase class C family)